MTTAAINAAAVAALAFIGPGIATTAVAGAIGLGLAAIAIKRRGRHGHGQSKGHSHGSGYGGHVHGGHVLGGHDQADHGLSGNSDYGGSEQKYKDWYLHPNDDGGTGQIHKGWFGHHNDHGGPRNKDKGGYGHHSDQDEYGHKWKRSTDVDDRISRLLEIIRMEDVTGCGLRLVCELAGKPEHNLTEDEADILALIGPPVKPGEGVLPDGARGEYQLARGLGESGSNCGRHFIMCPIDGSQLMNTITNFLP